MIEMALEEFKKKMGASSVELIANPNKKESATMKMKTDQEWMQEIQSMLEGKKKPTNEFVIYLLDKIREIQAEGQTLEKEIQGRSQQLEQMRVKAIQLQAVMHQYVQDVKSWIIKGEDKAKQVGAFYDKEASELLEKEVKHEGVAKPILGRT